MPQSPLYDIFDPDGALQAAAEARGDHATLESLMPEEERRSRLRQLANMGANGISGLGWLLDTPGSVVRGLLSGGPGKAISALWEDSEDRVTGRELLRQYGMAGDEDGWGNFLGGIASEVLLDPTTYIGAGLLGQAFKTTGGRLAGRAGLLQGADVAAHAAGMGRREFLRKATPRTLISEAPAPVRNQLRDQFMELAQNEATRRPSMLERITGQTTRPTVDQLLDMPVSRTSRVGFLGSDLGAYDLFGEKAGDWLAKTWDDAGEGMKQLPFIGPAYRVSQALFDPAVNRRIGYEDQWTQRRRTFDEGVRERGMRASIAPRILDAISGYRSAASTWSKDYAAQRTALEGEIASATQALSGGVPPQAAQTLNAQIARATAELEALERLAAAGGPLDPNSPEWGMAFRHAVENPGLGRMPSFSDPDFVGPPTRAAAEREARLAAAQDLFDPSRPGYQASPEAALVQYAQASKAGAKAVAEALAVPLGEFNSRVGTGWFPRQQLWFQRPRQPEWPSGVKPPTPREQKRVAGGLGESPLGDAYSQGRQPYMDILGGTATLDRMSTDAALQQALRKATDEEAPQIIEDWFRRRFSDWVANGPSAGVPNPTSYLHPWIDEIDPKTGEYAYRVVGELDAPPGSAAEALLASRESARKALGALPSELRLKQKLADAQKRQASIPLVLRPSLLGARLSGAARSIAAAQQKLAARTHLEADLLDIANKIEQATRRQHTDALLVQLADVLRRTDPQHAETGLPMFGQHPLNELLAYNTSRSKVNVNARSLFDRIASVADTRLPSQVPGGANYSWEEVASKLGFDKERFVKALSDHTGGAIDATEWSFPKVDIDNWSRALAPPSWYSELDPAREAFDNYTKRFKTLALFSPSRWVRDMNSGAFAAAMKGLYNWSDRNAGLAMARGDYGPLANRLEGAIGYAGLSPEERVRKFLRGAAEHDMATTGIVGELAAGTPDASMRELFPGSTTPASRRGEGYEGWKNFLTGGLVVGDNVPWYQRMNPFSIRAGAGNVNPALEFGDRISESTDAINRYGTYLTAVRKGYHPSEARRLSDLTQVDYRPGAFTDFERNVLKRAVPFYSYTKGILPLIADEALNNPSGVMGQSIRVMNRASEPDDDFFVPEYLRQSSSVPLEAGLPLIGLSPESNLQRFITNVDLPFEGPINLITPGVGNSLLDKLSSGVYKTGQNLLGMTHPIIKGPLELMTNRQFYSGRQLSDLYSVVEANTGLPAGRWLEHIAVNSPGGSKALGLLRQITDERLTPAEKVSKYLFKTATGMSIQDVDQDRTRRLAARNMLNDLLQKTPGVRTYENITVPEEQLRAMPEDQRRMYLLYKIVQTEAAKRARERKAAAQDPLQILGVSP